MKKRKQTNLSGSTDIYVESGQKRAKSSWPGLRTGEGQMARSRPSRGILAEALQP